MRLIRLSRTFFWAQTTTSPNGLNDCEEYSRGASNCTVLIDDARIGPLLLSPYGFRALGDAGQITTEELEGLTGSGLPPSQCVRPAGVGGHPRRGGAGGWDPGGWPRPRGERDAAARDVAGVLLQCQRL